MISSWYRIWKNLHHGRLPISSTSGLTAGSCTKSCGVFLSFHQNDTISQVLKVLFFGHLKHEECLSECRSYDWNFLLAACLLEVCIDETAPERLGVTLARQKFDFFGA